MNFEIILSQCTPPPAPGRHKTHSDQPLCNRQPTPILMWCLNLNYRIPEHSSDFPQSHRTLPFWTVLKTKPKQKHLRHASLP